MSIGLRIPLAHTGRVNEGESRRFKTGYRLAQLGALLHILGGLGDQSIRALLPAHIAIVGANAAAEPGVGRLVLALLHVLGSSLAAAGLALLILLHFWRRERSPRLALGIVAVALLAEGVNGAGLLSLGEWIGLVPLSFAVMVVVGVVVAGAARRGGAGDE
jgi:hypothetical protein